MDKVDVYVDVIKPKTGRWVHISSAQMCVFYLTDNPGKVGTLSIAYHLGVNCVNGYAVIRHIAQYMLTLDKLLMIPERIVCHSGHPFSKFMMNNTIADLEKKRKQLTLDYLAQGTDKNIRSEK